MDAASVEATPGAQAAAKAAGLPQTEDHWHLYVHKLRTWAPLPDAAGAAAAAGGEDDAEVSLELVRPYLLLLVCVTDGAFLSYASTDDDQTNVLTTAEPPTADEVVTFLCRAMAEPRVLNASMRNSPKCVVAAALLHPPAPQYRAASCSRCARMPPAPARSGLRRRDCGSRGCCGASRHAPYPTLTWRCLLSAQARAVPPRARVLRAHRQRERAARRARALA